VMLRRWQYTGGISHGRVDSALVEYFKVNKNSWHLRLIGTIV